MSDRVLHQTLSRLRRDNSWLDRATHSSECEFDESLGVNVAGYFRDESGWGSAGRRYLRAVQKMNIPYATCDLSNMTSNRSLHGEEEFGAVSTWPHKINLVCVDARHHYGMLGIVGEDFFEGKYNIGIWAWELPAFPKELYDRFAYYDEVWVATSFIADVISPVSPVPVVCVPPVLSSGREADGVRGRRLIDAKPDETVFLFIFDFHSHLDRKNPLATIQAFRYAFGPEDRARLVLKCVNQDADPDGFATLQQAADGASVDFRCGYWSAQDVRDLTAGCDAYVSLHRSEGTGLTISDAMALGRPVIATDWSGNTDFMDVSCSYPVKYELTEVQRTVGPYRQGEIWAEPSIEHAAALMREVYEHPESAKVIGVRAQRRLDSEFSCDAISARIAQRLTTISERSRLDEYREEIKQVYRGYRRLVHDVWDAVASAVPEGSKVSVVTKGDPDLLATTTAQAYHFPSTPDGIYCGYHPPDSDWAIDRLEAARAQGAEFLLIPGTSTWWLTHYAGFADHLEQHYRCVCDTPEVVLYQLARSTTRSANERSMKCHA